MLPILHTFTEIA